jgi:AcrR family transcriptional regulator
VPKIVDHARRREQIARLTVQVMCDDGPDGATVRRIADAGGFSIGVLTHYFQDKDELVAFAFRWLAQQSFVELDAAVAAAPPGLARLCAALNFMLPAPRAQSFIAVWLGLWSRATHNPALARVHRGYYSRWRRYLRRFLTEALRNGEVTRPRSVPDAIDLLVAGIDGLWIGAAFEPGRYPTRRRRDLVERLLAVVLAPPARRQPRSRSPRGS